MAPDVIADLHALLDDEKAAILDARFVALPALEAAKAHLLAELKEINPEQRHLLQIKAKLDENQSLLLSAIKGVSAARDRIAALHHVQQGLSVYDASGHLATVPAHHRGIEKKA